MPGHILWTDPAFEVAGRADHVCISLYLQFSQKRKTGTHVVGYTDFSSSPKVQDMT